jgi:outer membrane protein OmpA-like peptidoglycan-associated protein
MVRRFGILLGSASLLALTSVAALADPAPYTPSNGPYIDLGVTGVFPRDSSPKGVATRSDPSGYDGNVGGEGGIGYGFGNGWRYELEGAYNNNDVNYIRSGTPHGSVTQYTLFGNVLYDIDTTQFGYDNGGFVPHLGVGVGWAHVKAAHPGFYNGGYTLTGEDDALAYQGIAGVGYAIAPDLKLDLDYRFVGTDTERFKTTPGYHLAYESFQNHEVVLAVRWEFNEPAPAPQPAAPPPPPPPPPPVQPVQVPEKARSFQVFFDFDKSNITSAAARVIASAADSVKQGNLTRITVTGHTDTVGSAKYNQALSERRAAAVKAALISDGVDGGEITTVGVGKTGLLVPTADGVREPQNRRAEIVLQ